MSDPSADLQVERLLERTLRELPPRPAPPSLEARVFAELQRRAAQPWWRRSFAHWPLLARAGFVLMCAALVGLACALSIPGARYALAAANSAGQLAALITGATAPDWVYGGLVVAAALYAALFGLAVAAYRTLYLNSQISGDLRT